MFNFFGRFTKRKDQDNSENGSTNSSKEKSKEQPAKHAEAQRKSLTHSPKFFNKTKDKNKLNADAKQESAPPVNIGIPAQKKVSNVLEYENRVAATTDAGNEIPDADATLQDAYLGAVPYEANSYVRQTSSDDTKSTDSVNSAIKDLIAPMGWKSRAKAKSRAAQKKATPVERNAQAQPSVNINVNTCISSKSQFNTDSQKSDNVNATDSTNTDTKISSNIKDSTVGEKLVKSDEISADHNRPLNVLQQTKHTSGKVDNNATPISTQNICNGLTENKSVSNKLNGATPINGIIKRNDQMTLIDLQPLSDDKHMTESQISPGDKENVKTDESPPSYTTENQINDVTIDSAPIKPPRQKNIVESTGFKMENSTTNLASPPHDEGTTDSIFVNNSQRHDENSEDMHNVSQVNAQTIESIAESNTNDAINEQTNKEIEIQHAYENKSEPKQSVSSIPENTCTESDTIKNADTTDKMCRDVSNEVIVALNPQEASDKLEPIIGETPNSQMENMHCFEKDAVNCATDQSVINVASNEFCDRQNDAEVKIDPAVTSETCVSSSEQVCSTETAVSSKIPIDNASSITTKDELRQDSTLGSSEENLVSKDSYKENTCVSHDDNIPQEQNTSQKIEMKNLVNQEARFQEQISDLTEKLSTRETDTFKLHYEMEDLHRELYAKTSGMDRLQAELLAAHKETEYVRIKLRHLESDLTSFKQKNRDLEEEISKKSEEAITIKNSNSEKAAELETKVNELTSRIEKLDIQLKSIKEERDKFEEKCKILEKEREEERNIVQHALEEAMKEKKTIQQQWEKDFEKLRTVNTGREQQLLDDFEWKLREVEQTCKRRLEEKEKKTQELVKDAHKAIEEKVKRAEQQLNEVLHLKSYEAEVSQLRGLTHDQQRSLRLMSERTEQLQLEGENLKAEIIRLKSLLENEKNNLTKLQNSHIKDLLEKDRLMQIQIEQEKSEVAVRWEERLRNECLRLKMELDQLHHEEKQLALESFKSQKELEFGTAKQNWEKKNQDNVKEITLLKDTIVKKEEQYKKKMERLQTNADHDTTELRRSIDKIDTSYTNQIEKLIEKYEKKIEELNDEFEKRMKDSETNWQMQLTSTKTALELVKDQMDQESENKLLTLDQHHRSQLEHQWEQLVQDKEEALQSMEQKYRSNCDKLKEEITTVQKNYKTKEIELLKKIDDLKNELRLKEYLMNDIQNNVDTLHGGIQVLNQEILHQNKEIIKVQDTATKKIREMRDKLKGEHEIQLTEQKCKFMSELQKVKDKSNHCIEDIQKKYHILTKMYEEIRLKYEKREYRPEDINLIADLRQIITEQEKDIASLTEEKRFYQLEVMNRRGIPTQALMKKYSSESINNIQHSPSPEFETAHTSTDLRDCLPSCNFKSNLKICNNDSMLPLKCNVLESIEEIPCDEDNALSNNSGENSINT